MFDFVFVNLYLNLQHHKTLFCDGYKEEVRRGYSDKNTKLSRNLKKVGPIKMLLLNLTYQEVAYMEENCRKNYDTFKNSSLSR